MDTFMKGQRVLYKPTGTHCIIVAYPEYGNNGIAEYPVMFDNEQDEIYYVDEPTLVAITEE